MPKRSVTLAVPEDALAAITARRPKAVENAIARTLKIYDRADSALAGFLQDFCGSTRESYAHESLWVRHVEVKTPTRGSVSIEFTGDAYMGCKNADYLHDHEETLGYKLNVARGQLELTGDFPEQRTTKDEF